MDEHFDAVVVGSGFGGSVVAYRLAEAGLSVCLLERGRAFGPGDFPRSPGAMRNNFWDPSEGQFGMFSVWAFRHINALVSAGLGGGSLIYANVLLRKDERWFADEQPDGSYQPWPLKRSDLDPHYESVERMMNVQRYPFDRPPYDATFKTRAFQNAAAPLGATFGLPPLAVTFANRGEEPQLGEPIVEEHRNLHGRTRTTCRLCGECDIGCNYGSKNTLDYTYLSAAKRKGADIRTLCEVKTFRPRANGGYEIEYVKHDLRNAGRKRPRGEQPPRTKITASRLIISAGTLGSTYLLLRNRTNLPALSKPALGTRFCGNGDLLGFMLRCTDRKTGARTDVDPSRAPVITSYLRMADAADGAGAKGRGFYIEDGGHPEFVNYLVEATQAPGYIKRGLRFVWHRLQSILTNDPRAELTRDISALMGPCDFSSSSFPILGMGRDVADGNMTLSGKDFLQVDWRRDSSEEYFAKLRGTMVELSRLLGAKFLDNPIWYFKRVVTVHPLGGCPMADDAVRGVVDARGEVFGHRDLYVADGSILPGPVGANPSLTIAAIADRIADGILERRSVA